MHHIITDGWSMGVLVAELGVFYNAAVSGQPPRLPELAVQYVDYAVWQRELLTGAALDTAMGYWREQLAGMPVLELPTDRPRPAVLTSAGALHEFVVPARSPAGSKTLGRRLDGTLFMTSGRGVSGAVRSLFWARRYRGGYRGVGPGSGRVGRVDRVFRQHPGVAFPGGRRASFRNSSPRSGRPCWMRSFISRCPSNASSMSSPRSGTPAGPPCSRPWSSCRTPPGTPQT